MTMTTPAYHRLAALLTLLVVLMLLAGIMMSGFNLAQRQQAEVSARATHLTALRSHIARLSSSIAKPGLAGNRREDVERFFLPASAPGAAGALLQSRLITLTEKAGGRVSSARVSAPVKQDSLNRISVDITVEIKTKGLRDLLLAIETGTPVTIIDRLSVRRIDDPDGDRSTSSAQQDPLLNVTLRISSYMVSIDGTVKQ